MGELRLNKKRLSSFPSGLTGRSGQLEATDVAPPPRQARAEGIPMDAGVFAAAVPELRSAAVRPTVRDAHARATVQPRY